MTAPIPMTATQVVRPASPSIGAGSALDRIAYVVLCGFVFSLPWAEGLSEGRRTDAHQLARALSLALLDVAFAG